MSKCTKCLNEVPLKEFLANDHRCKKCNKLPNYQSKRRKKCKGCKHTPHVEVCREGIATSGPPKFEIVEVCNCEVLEK